MCKDCGKSGKSDPEIMQEALIVGVLATGMQFTVGIPVPSVGRVFVVNAVACAIYNELIRKTNRPVSTMAKIRRGVGYGLVAATIAYFVPPFDPLVFFVEATVASAIGNKSAPFINKQLGITEY